MCIWRNKTCSLSPSPVLHISRPPLSDFRLFICSPLRSGNFMWRYQESVKLPYTVLYNPSGPYSFHRQMTYFQLIRPFDLLQKLALRYSKSYRSCRRMTCLRPAVSQPCVARAASCDTLLAAWAWVHLSSWPPGAWLISPPCSLAFPSVLWGPWDPSSQ